VIRAVWLANRSLRIVEPPPSRSTHAMRQQDRRPGVAHLALADAAGPPYAAVCGANVAGRMRPDWVDGALRSTLRPCPRCAALYREAERWGR